MTAVNRLTSRILLFNENGQVLLFLTKAPDTSGVARWITPGGGVDPGENHAEAAIRELSEETGMVVTDVGEPVWSHDFTVQWDAADHSTGHAEFYSLRTETFVPSSANWTDDERVDVVAHRWFSVTELLATEEAFEPAELPELINGL